MKKIYEEISACRLCFSTQLTDVLDLGSQPPANSLRKNLNEEVPTAPLKLVHCGQCSAVQLTATVDPTYLFSNYFWVTGTSATARSYCDFFTDEVLKRTQTKNPLVVEVASNDGTFLKALKKKGCEVFGVDPAKNIADKASQEGIPTYANFFDSSMAKKILAEHSRPGVVIARNVIPHVKEIHSIVSGMSDLVDDQGTVVIEFHYAKSILQELHYDSIYHEHLFYFSLQSLSHLFAKYNLKPFDCFVSPISGGSVVLFFSKKNLPQSADLKNLLGEEERLGLNQLKTWQEFGTKAIEHAKKLKDFVTRYSKQSKLIGYGASARSSTMMNFAKISTEDLEIIIDRNPLKQNLYTPGTNIKILSFEDGLAKSKGRSILLLAWNFEEEIMKDLSSSGYKGDVIVPLPNTARVKHIGAQ